VKDDALAEQGEAGAVHLPLDHLDLDGIAVHGGRGEQGWRAKRRTVSQGSGIVA
jgi:hypothetical protein